MSAREFSLEGYRSLLAAFSSLGYRVVGFEDVQPKEAHLIVRHDIDFDLARAVELAELESEMGTRANYYLLLRTEFYNVFSGAGHKYARRLTELGHNVGLHFDASLYPPERADLEAAAERECRILEDHLGLRIDTITFHRPAPSLQGLEGRFAGRLHGYDPRFFSAIGYCSDSEGRWRFGHPLDHEAVKEKRAMQLVTHPVWWCAPAGETVIQKLSRLGLEKSEMIRVETARNCKPYKGYLRAICAALDGD